MTPDQLFIIAAFVAISAGVLFSGYLIVLAGYAAKGLISGEGIAAATKHIREEW